METLEPVRNGTPAPLEARTDGAAVAGGDLLLTWPEVSALCSAGPVRSKVLQTSNRAGISNGLKRIRPAVPEPRRGRSDSTGKEIRSVL